LQKLGPINADFVVIEDDGVAVEPVFDLFNVFDGDRVDPYMVLVVLVDQRQVKVSYIASHAFKPHHFDVLNAKHKEVGLGDVD
jgi:hypothetical protein